MLNLADLKVRKDQVRTFSSEDVHRLSVSVDKMGVLRPLVVNGRNMAVLDGALVAKALRAAGAVAAPCWVVDLPPELEMTAHLALQNHVGEWNWQAVSEALQAVQAAGLAVDLTGFHSSDTGPLLAADWTPAKQQPLDGSDASQTTFL